MSEHAEGSSEAPAELELADQEARQVVARYGRMGHLGVFAHELETLPVPGMAIVARTDRGAELAHVLIGVCRQCSGCSISAESLEAYLTANGPDYPVTRGGRVLRAATAQDLNDQQHLDRSAMEEGAFCREQIKQLGLQMRLVCVEHLLGGERIVFYFAADQRIDFRELVRRLAGQYHTRVEMRQVGARDEARLTADYERCGRRCCCQEYLKLLKPVSMRMAKAQKATLDPTKISGRCGRLMCCLRYEDAAYEELQQRLPGKNTWVRTADGVVGRVIDGQILTQLVRLRLPDQSYLVVANEDIVERGIPEPLPQAVEAVVETPRRPAKSVRIASQASGPAEKAVRAEPRGAAEQARPAAPGPGEKPAGEPTGSRRKRRRRGKKPRHPQALSVPPRPPGQSGGIKGQPASGRPARKRRRRGRGKGSGGNRPDSAPKQ